MVRGEESPRRTNATPGRSTANVFSPATKVAAEPTLTYRDFLTNSYDVESSDADRGTNGTLLTGMCDCVWNKGSCGRCSQYDSFKCYYCPMVFLKADVRNRHLRISHRKELLKHSVTYFRDVGMKEETESRYECDKCGDVYDDKVRLIEHLRKHMPKRVRATKEEYISPTTGVPPEKTIPETGKLPSRKREAKRHQLWTPTRTRRVTRSSPRLPYQCEHCAERVRSKVEMRKHLGSVHGFTAKRPTTQKANGDAKIAKELARLSFKTVDANGAKVAAGYYICAVCGHIFLRRHSFTRHVNLHSSRRYDCDACKKSFISESVLKLHQNRKHKELPKNVFLLNGRKYLKCEQCPFTCRNERNKLEEHMRVHTGEKPFTCELCGKQFRTRALLRVHCRYVHEGVKEHACDICGRCFSNKRYMEEHRRIHTGEKPLICDLCGKTFRQNSSLSKHVENHLGIKRHGCHLCGKRFSNSHHLNIHIKRHMGEASYVCDHCGKGFVDQYQLKNHQVVHSEERPYVCAVCGTGFKLVKHLKQHGKTHRTD